MKIYGRSVDRTQTFDINFGELVFEDKNSEIVLSIYRAKVDGRIEIRTPEGSIIVIPRVANVIEIENRR